MQYTDQVAIATKEKVTFNQLQPEVLSIRVREFPVSSTYGVFVHIGRVLVESTSGPLSEIHKGQDRVDAIKRQLGPKVTWRPDCG